MSWEEFNKYPHTICGVIEKWAEETPDKIALIPARLAACIFICLFSKILTSNVDGSIILRNGLFNLLSFS